MCDDACAIRSMSEAIRALLTDRKDRSWPLCMNYDVMPASSGPVMVGSLVARSTTSI